MCMYSPAFLSCVTIFMVLCAQVMWHRVEHQIRELKEDHQSSLNVDGTWHIFISR